MNNKPLQRKPAIEPIDVVTPVGNAWVINKSKSHPGRIYYFNTLTGEAVWNLSGTDIEKAKNTTNILENQPGTCLENYPEPKEPPSDNNPNYNINQVIQPCTQSNEYNELAMNKQFQQTFGLNSIVSTQCLKCTSMNTCSISDTSISAPTAFNPKIWDIPPNHQILITPSQSPIVNQTQTSVNVAYNNMDSEMFVQNTTLPLSRHFKDTQHSKFENRNQTFAVNKFSPGFHHNQFNQRNYYPKKSFNNILNESQNFHSKDLRQILCSKRNINIYEDSVSQENRSKLPNFSQEKSNVQSIKIITPTVEDLCPSDIDDHWLKEHAFVQGTQLKLNIEELKMIVMSKQDLHCWYIICDSYTLLNHFNLINIIVNSDEQCQLMLQENLMTELRTISKSADMSHMIRAFFVLKLLAQQFAAHRAVLGVESDNCRNYDILDFSIKFSEQNNNVALVSNNLTFKTRKTKSIPIFTIKELKDILTREHVGCKPKLENHSNTSITVTIPNNMDFKESSLSSNAVSDVKSQLNKETEMKLSNNKKSNNEKSFIPKSTMEMGVQTDSNDMKSVTDSFCNPHNQGESVAGKNNINMSEAPKKRLIRNVLHQSNGKNEKTPDKRQFIWRRKKRHFSAIDTLRNKHSDNNSGSDLSVTNINEKAVPISDYLSTKNLLEETCNEKNYDYKTYHEDNCSETTTSSTFVKRDNSSRIIIEETSTSGIISNTASNVDSESDHSLLPVKEINLNDSNDKCVMFEIESSAMEDSLKMKSDEWVSRFVQIMEEVLTEILQRDPPFYSAMLPPPWTLHEAAACIKKKFSMDSDIIDAASKLADVLYKISDDRGKINTRLGPIEFMEIYSYGVYLVDSLQTRLNECEDVQTAQESLANLLSDIQDPNVYNVQNDNFSDNNNDVFSANVTPLSSSETADNNGSINNAIEMKENFEKNQHIEEECDHDNRFNLRSTEKKRNEVTKEQSVKFIRNIDLESTFFFTLNLQRKPIHHDNPESIENSILIETNKENEIECKVPVPKIIRNFSKCLEFEKRLKYQENNDMHINLSNYTDDEHDYDYYDENYNSNEEYTEECEAENYEENDKNHLSGQLEHKMNDFKWIAGRVMSEVRETFLEVHLFCDKIHEELKVFKKLSLLRRHEIQEKAQEAHKHMCYLNASLKSILHRMDNSFNMQIILKQANILVDMEKSDQYRDKIAKCIEQGAVLLDAVNMVIEAVE